MHLDFSSLTPYCTQKRPTPYPLLLNNPWPRQPLRIRTPATTLDRPETRAHIPTLDSFTLNNPTWVSWHETSGSNSGSITHKEIHLKTPYSLTLAPRPRLHTIIFRSFYSRPSQQSQLRSQHSRQLGFRDHLESTLRCRTEAKGTPALPKASYLAKSSVQTQDTRQITADHLLRAAVHLIQPANVS